MISKNKISELEIIKNLLSLIFLHRAPKGFLIFIKLLFCFAIANSQSFKPYFNEQTNGRMKFCIIEVYDLRGRDLKSFSYNDSLILRRKDPEALYYSTVAYFDSLGRYTGSHSPNSSLGEVVKYKNKSIEIYEYSIGEFNDTIVLWYNRDNKLRSENHKVHNGYFSIEYLYNLDYSIAEMYKHSSKAKTYDSTFTNSTIVKKGKRLKETKFNSDGDVVCVITSKFSVNNVLAKRKTEYFTKGKKINVRKEKIRVREYDAKSNWFVLYHYINGELAFIYSRAAIYD